MPFLSNNAMIITALEDVAAHKIVISNVIVNVFWNVKSDRNLSRIATPVNVIWRATVRIVSRIAILVLVNAVCGVTANNNVRRTATMANVIWCVTVRIVSRSAILVLVNAVCNATTNNLVRRYATMVSVHWNAMDQTVRIIVKGISTAASRRVKLQMSYTSARTFVSPTITSAPLLLLRR